MEQLSREGWRGVAVSRRGRLGVGPERAEGLRVGDYVEDTVRVVRALGEEPILVGHSLGGLVAQKVAEQGVGAGLVLLAPAPAAMLTAQPVALPAYLPLMPNILTGRPLMPTCDACSRIALNCVPEAQRAAIHDGFEWESGLAYREMIFGSVRVDPARVRVPTLVIGGREDRVVSESLLRFTAERYGAPLRIYDGHAHWLMGEPGYDRIVADTGRWLEERIGSFPVPPRPHQLPNVSQPALNAAPSTSQAHQV
jgi:pimeloyl-ACP methyl ester carboxylesterase